MLSADHGDMMGSHGLIGKYVWYEESIRIPFVVRVPGNEKRRCRTCIASQDMTPTLLGILGVSIPSTVEGEDCSSYLLTERRSGEGQLFVCLPSRDIFFEKFARGGQGSQGVRMARGAHAGLHLCD